MPGTPQILDLDKAAAAFDQRSVPMALGRTYLIFGSLFALGAAWPPANVIWSGIGLVLAIGGLLVLLAFRHPGRGPFRALAGISALLLGVALLADAVQGAGIVGTPLLKPFDTMSVDFMAALALANARYGAPSWLIARSITSLLEMAVGLELVVAGWLFLRLRAAEARLLDERSGSVVAGGLSLLLDLPPGLVRYLRAVPLAAFAAVAAMLLFSLATTNLAGARMIQHINALVVVAACFEHGAPVAPCFEANGDQAATGMLMLAASGLLLLPWLGSWSINRARGRAALTAATRLANDHRPPILFLRSFKDDQVLLPRPRWAVARFPFGGLPSVRALDHILIERFLPIAPIKALWSSREHPAPFGAVREAVDDADWQAEVGRLARAACKIVLVFDGQGLGSGSGLTWEIDHIGQHADLLAKTLFIIHPDWQRTTPIGATGDPTAANHALWRAVGARAGFVVPRTTRPLLSCAVNADGTIVATTAGRFDSTTVLLALRRFFQP